MKKRLGRLGCLVVAFALILTAFGAVTVSAADVEIWNVSAAMTKDVPVQAFNGITVTAMENLKYAGSGATVDEVKFTGNLQNTSGDNAKVDEEAGVVTGPALKIDTTRTGTFSIAAKVSVGKGFRVVDANNISTEIYNVTADVATRFFSFNVEAGKSYYAFGVGTKPTFYGATFEEKQVVPAGAGETVTIKATPGSNALLGNVRLSDDTIPLNKGTGMLESTFVMPEKNITVKVDFVSNAVVDEIKAISFDSIKGTNESENEVYDDLDLFDTIKTSIGDPDVSWESSNEAVISKSGEVNATTVDTQVDFTGVFSYQDYPNIFLYKTFHLTVPADNDDAGAVADAKEALTLGDTSAVKKNLDLPTSGRRGTTITWASSNPQIVGADGSVNPANGVDNTVVLTATITRGEVSDTKEFTIFVPGIVPIVIERAAVSNSEGNVVVTPAEGCYLSHIVYTDSINNKTGKEAIEATVYSSDRSQKLCSKVFNIKEYSEKPECYDGDQRIIYIDKDAVPVSEGCIIEIKSYEDIDNKTVELSKSYTYSYGIASNPTVYVAGDSTACTYDVKNFPRTGWAAVLQNYFGSGVKINDLAISGRSSLSFLSEKNYTTIKNSIKSGDYFIVQFGHNDSKSDDAARYTDPSGDRFTQGSYKHNIYENYVKLALDKGAYPIITTSISRRSLSDAGLEAYVNAAKALGQELGLPVVDLYSKVNGYINEVGTEQAKDIYNYVHPKDSRFMNMPEGDFTKSSYYSTGTTDNTHINIFGAKMISQWFCDELVRISHPLTSKRNDVTMSVEDIPSYAEAATASTASAELTALGDEYSVTCDYDSSLGTVEIVVGTPAGYTISSGTYNENGKLQVSYSSSEVEGGAALIAVTYDSDGQSIIDCAVYDIGAQGDEEFDYPKHDDGVTKLLIWSSMDNMIPLSPMYTVE